MDDAVGRNINIRVDSVKRNSYRDNRPGTDIRANNRDNHNNIPQQDNMARQISHRDIHGDKSFTPYDEQKVREIIHKYSNTNSKPDSGKLQNNHLEDRKEEMPKPTVNNYNQTFRNNNGYNTINPRDADFSNRQGYNPRYEENRQQYNKSVPYDKKVEFFQLDKFSPPANSNININYQVPEHRKIPSNNYTAEMNQSVKRKEDINVMTNYTNRLTQDYSSQRNRPYSDLDNRMPSNDRIVRNEEQYKLDPNSKNFLLEKLNRLGSTNEYQRKAQNI
jgi:hypothetical protein